MTGSKKSFSKNQNNEVTIYHIAEALNVSAATVSRAINNDPAVKKSTRLKIFDKANEMGFRLNTHARGLKVKQTFTIGVIVPRLNSFFMSDVLAGMENICNIEGYEMIISQSLELMEKEEKNALNMFNKRVDGLLVSLAYNTTNIDHFNRFIERNIPLIFFDRVMDHPNCPTIEIKNFHAAYEITSHLIEQGAKKIFHVTGNQSKAVYSERNRGYQTALSDNNIELKNDRLIINNLSMEDGKDVAYKILEMSEKPDAIFFDNDTCAVSCLLELKKNGIITPDDILIAGFNNDPISTIVEPNLTTVDYKGYELGEVAAKTLINFIKDENQQHSTSNIIIRHSILIRDSTNNIKNQ